VAARRGNVAMMFALALPVLVMVSFGAIDIHQASKVKANLQDALDAAALAAARSKYTDDVNLNRVGMAALKANMPAYFQDGTGDTASFTLEGNKIVADANVNVKVLVANIVLPPCGQGSDRSGGAEGADALLFQGRPGALFDGRERRKPC